MERSISFEEAVAAVRLSWGDSAVKARVKSLRSGLRSGFGVGSTFWVVSALVTSAAAATGLSRRG